MPVSAIDWIPRVGLLFAMLLWGSSFVAFKIALAGLHPYWMLWLRMALAALCFALLLARLRIVPPRPGDLKYWLLMVLLEPCLYFLFEAVALANTSAAAAGMITALLPALVALLAGIVLKERVTPQTGAGFALAIAGAAWLSVAAEVDTQAPAPLFGNLFELLAMLCAAGYTVLMKRLSRHYDPLFLTALQAWAGALFFAPLLLLPSTPWPSHWPADALLAVAYLGTVITLGAYGLYNYGISRVPAVQAAGFTNLIPVFTVMFGFAILGERFTPAQFAASALVFAGVGLSQWDDWRRHRAPPGAASAGS